ncbi:MAG: recombination protein O N-terminal domain-containing protein [Flavobacteriales bacterium]|nr:recombination protein O N-terminal domain-containing protein [Flavobacteriales bacterium]
MLHATRALVLRTFKHKDHSLVLRAYTEDLGVRSLAVRSRDRRHRGLLGPLNRLQLVLDERPDRELASVKEISLEEPFRRVGNEPLRMSVLLFMQEVLYRALREESADVRLFHFIQLALEHMDSDEDLSHFPLQFLVHLSKHLGFFPEARYEGTGDRFDLREGCFIGGFPEHSQVLDVETSRELTRLLRGRLGEVMTPPIVPRMRAHLLEQLNVYFALHLSGLGQFRSVEVLKQVLA